MRRFAILLTLTLSLFPACDDGTSETDESSTGTAAEPTAEPEPRAANPVQTEFLAKIESAHSEYRETGRIPRICILSVCASCEESWVPTPGIHCKVSTPSWGCEGHCGYVCSGYCWGN